MNLLHLSCIAPPQPGGTGRVAFEIVKRLVARGESATLIAPQSKITLTEPDAPFVKRLPAFPRWGNAAALQGLQPHLAEADVIHLHYPFYGTAEQVAQYCLWHRKPLVMTFHMDSRSPGLLGLTFGLYRIFAQPAVLRTCKKIFIASADYADASSIAGFKAAHLDRFVELPFGVDHERFSSGANERERFGIPPDVKVIGFVGAMDHAHRFKGAKELLAAAAGLPTDVHLLLVGEGDQRRIYEAKAKELGIANRCHFAGHVPQDDLPSAYRSMDVFAFPSTNGAEAFGLVAAEAMACGIPVVASNLPGVRTVVKNGETGLLVPPKDVSALQTAITGLLGDEPRRRAYGSAAHRLAAERFDWDRHVERLAEEYREAVTS